VHFKKLILIYLLVVYCVLIGENESIKSQGRVEDRKTKEKVIYNVILLRISFYKNGENVNRKKKGKKRNNK
jgi:hypothetical protein